jgi:hypothetical protein
VFPLICPPYHSRIDELSFHIRTASASTYASIGAYRNVEEEGNLYPGRLIVDSGAISTASTGVKTWTVNILCQPGELLWIAFNNTSALPVWTGFTRSTVSNTMLGAEDRTVLTDGAVGHYIAQTFGAMPATFPLSGRGAATNDFPALYVHFAPVR